MLFSAGDTWSWINSGNLCNWSTTQNVAKGNRVLRCKLVFNYRGNNAFNWHSLHCHRTLQLIAPNDLNLSSDRFRAILMSCCLLIYSIWVHSLVAFNSRPCVVFDFAFYFSRADIISTPTSPPPGCFLVARQSVVELIQEKTIEEAEEEEEDGFIFRADQTVSRGGLQCGWNLEFIINQRILLKKTHRKLWGRGIKKHNKQKRNGSELKSHRKEDLSMVSFSLSQACRSLRDIC